MLTRSQQSSSPPVPASSVRSSNQARRYSSDEDGDDYGEGDEDDEKSDQRGSLQYTRDSLSMRGFDDTIDSNLGKSIGRSSVSSRYADRKGNDDSGDEDAKSAFDLSQEDGERGHYFGDTNTHSAGTLTSDISRDIDEDTDHDHLDLNQTIVTDISGPGDDVAERANAYERSARQGDTVKLAPTTPQNQPSSASNRPAFTASSRGTASPFDTMTSDFDDDGSLELSQSNDMFGNYAEPPRSARFSGRDEK
jgi:hypothetical protein